MCYCVIIVRVLTENSLNFSRYSTSTPGSRSRVSVGGVDTTGFTDFVMAYTGFDVFSLPLSAPTQSLLIRSRPTLPFITSRKDKLMCMKWKEIQLQFI